MGHELSEELLRHWAPRLRFFRYVKALGSHFNDIAELVLVLGYSGENDLTGLLDELGIPYTRFSTQPPQPEAGKGYPEKEFAKFPSLIPGTRWIQQPVWQSMDSVPISVWCGIDRMNFTLVGPRERDWAITETKFENAKRLEHRFESHASRIIDPPVDARNCVCPKYYPQYWEAG